MNRLTKYILLAIGFFTPFAIQAQEEILKPSFLENNGKGIFLILIITSFVVVFIALYTVLKSLLFLMAKESLGVEAAEKYTIIPTFNFKWKRLNKTLTDAVPIELEEDIMLDHDYDGIKELDNHLPPWWKWMFYISIAWSIAFFGYFHVWKLGDDQYDIYDKKIALLEIQKADYLANAANSVDESSVVLITDAGRISNGASLFKANCVSCHGELAEGKIGPNLTDDYWLHGGSISDIFKTIKYGVPNKMIPWQDQLLPSEISEIASFVASLHGTNPPGGLEPQGELFTPSNDAEPIDTVKTEI